MSQFRLHFIMCAGAAAFALAACTTQPSPVAPVAEAPPAKPVCEPTTGAMTPSQRLRKAVELLSNGLECQARAETLAYQQAFPESEYARTLLFSMDVDPAKEWGGKAFTYVVQRGDSLGSISRRFLGDARLFYVIARYNHLATANQLNVGDAIQVPGERIEHAAPVAPDAPTPATADTEPAADSVIDETAIAATSEGEAASARHAQALDLTQQGVAAEASGNLPAAYEDYVAALKVEPGFADAAQRKSAISTKVAEVYYVQATEAMQAQDPERAISLWKRTLEVNPNHPLAAHRIKQAEDILNALSDVH